MFNRRDILSFGAALSAFSLSPNLVLGGAHRSKFLILVELQGANDGLNTVVPYASKRYYNLRPNISLSKDSVLTIDDLVGLHPSLSRISNLYYSGSVKIIQGLGYPHPILSHFRSIELWERGGDGLGNGRKGWLVDPLQIISEQLSPDAKAIFLDNAGEIFTGGLDGFLGPDALDESVLGLETSSTSMLSAGNGKNKLLGELIGTRDKNRERLTALSEKLSGSNKYFNFGRGELGQQLSKVCELLGAGVNIPVFKVSIGSFDTHDDQLRTHRDLLRELDASIGEAVDALKDIGVWNDTLIMTYSEFGRRARENGSRGTDHGMAAPHFILGGQVKGGVFGDYPQLGQLDRDNQTYTIDYRSVYNLVLSEHFGLKDNPFTKYDYNSIT